MAVDPVTFFRTLGLFLHGLFWSILAAAYSISRQEGVPVCYSKREFFRTVRKLDSK